MYRINSDQMVELKLEGEVILRKKDILEKYKETTRILFKNIKWSDHDLFYKFQDLVKKRDTDDLKFYNRDIKIY